MRRRRFSPFAVALAIALGGCSHQAPEKPVRLHAPPLTPDIVATRGERPFESYERQVVLIGKWVKESGISRNVADGLLDAVRQTRDQTGRSRTLSAEDFVNELKAWLAAGEGKDSAHQAAVYLVADRALQLGWRPFMLNDTTQQEAATARDALKAMGAQTFLSEASGGMICPGNWLQTAAQLDPRGSMGQRAILLLLETDCASGTSPSDYHSIVQHLETLLANPADSEVKFTAQLLEADAYADIVALGQGFGRENADSAKFAPEAADARAKALALYDAALTIDSTSRLARGGKLARDRLASGQRVDHARFFCFAE